MPAMTVFTEAIKFLKNHLENAFKEKKIDIRPKEIHWILTVPAIWNDAAKQFMREAAVEVSTVKTFNIVILLDSSENLSIDLISVSETDQVTNQKLFGK